MNLPLHYGVLGAIPGTVGGLGATDDGDGGHIDCFDGDIGGNE